MITSVIIENDLRSTKYLYNLLAKHLPDISVLGQVTSIKEGIKSINSLKPELVFLDIELDDGLGFEILDNVDTSQFEIIFITAHDNYYKLAIEHYAFSYILKPFDFITLEKVIKRYTIKSKHNSEKAKFQYLKEFLSKDDSKILLQTGDTHISVLLDDIYSCHSAGNFTEFFLQNKKVLVSNRLKYFEKLLNSKGFFKINRTTLFNTSKIDYIYKKETVVLKNKEKLHVSTRNKPLLSKLINTLS